MSISLTTDGPAQDRIPDMKQGLVGVATAGPEGKVKVTGSAVYAAEELPEGCVFGVLVRASAPGAVTLENAAELSVLPGVLLVLHYPAMIRRTTQGTSGEAPPQGPGTADFSGQSVALIVARSFDEARHAARLAKVHASGPNPELDPETVTPEGEPTAQGDLDGAMRDATHRIDALYRTSSMVDQIHLLACGGRRHGASEPAHARGGTGVASCGRVGGGGAGTQAARGAGRGGAVGASDWRRARDRADRRSGA